MSAEPRRIDRYEILSRISEGGMGTVYHARFEATGGVTKQVALKLIHPHLSREPELVRMFITEMRVAMAMSHRNVVHTFDAGTFGDRHYLVMELMNRGSLGELTKIPLDVAVLIAIEVCAALDYAHTFREEPVIHRDVSPSNILLSDQGDVKLTDFGVAKVSGQLFRTSTGMVKGKLRYMAPEQARGEVEPRSDLFALGAVLYWMVTGEPLRPNPSLEQVRVGDRVSFPAPRAGTVPRALQQLIERCLRRDPALRPASAAELRGLLAAELGLIQLGLGVDGDALARLRGFFAPRAPVVAEPDPRQQPQRVADEVLKIALEVPTHHGQPVDPDEVPTLEAPTEEAALTVPAGPTKILDRAATAETSASPLRQRAQAQAPRARGSLLEVGLIGAALLIIGAIVWALWPGAPADQSPAHTTDASRPASDASRPADAGVSAPGR